MLKKKINKRCPGFTIFTELDNPLITCANISLPKILLCKAEFPPRLLTIFNKQQKFGVI